MVLHQENVFGFNITMKNAVPVHVVDCLQQLVHVVLDSVLRQVVPLALDGVVHVHVHELEDECEAARRLIAIIENQYLGSGMHKSTLLKLIDLKIICDRVLPIDYLLEYFIKLDNLRVRTEPPQGLNFSQVIDLLDIVEVVLHALNCHIFACLNALCF